MPEHLVGAASHERSRFVILNEHATGRPDDVRGTLTALSGGEHRHTFRRCPGADHGGIILALSVVPAMLNVLGLGVIWFYRRFDACIVLDDPIRFQAEA